jgi:chromate transporter
VLGGVVAGTFFVLPSVFVLLGLSWLAVAYGDVPVVRGLLYGLQPVVIAIVLDALIRIGRRTLRNVLLGVFAALAFVAIYFLHLPFPLVIATAALGGLVLQRWRPHVFHTASHSQPSAPIDPPQPSLVVALMVLAVFAVLWFVPLAALLAWRGWQDVLTQEMWFFTQAAFVTFGGAYAVLSYIADVAVNSYHWVTAAEMVRGLGLAESTPGPLIMVTEYVGFLAAWQNTPPGFPRLLNATLGALVTVYATFLPTFFFIFIGAPYIEVLSHNRRLDAALTGVTAAIVGVIANLAVFFALHVLFPDGGSFDVFAASVAVLSFAVLRRLAVPTYALVPAGALLGMVRLLLLPLS